MPISVHIEVISWEDLCAAFDCLHRANHHLRVHRLNPDDMLARGLLLEAAAKVLYDMEEFINRTGGN